MGDVEKREEGGRHGVGHDHPIMADDGDGGQGFEQQDGDEEHRVVHP